MTIGVESVFYFNVTDDNNDFTVSLEDGLPINSQIQQVDNTSAYTFTWNLTSIGNYSLVFQALDLLGASSVLSVQVQICACQRDGNCTLDGLLDTSGSSFVLNCECPAGTFVFMYMCTCTCIC